MAPSSQSMATPHRDPERFVLPPFHKLGLRGELWNEIIRKSEERERYYQRYQDVRNKIICLKEQLHDAGGAGKHERANGIREGADGSPQNVPKVEDEIQRLEKMQDALSLVIHEEDRELGRILSNCNVGSLIMDIATEVVSVKKKTAHLLTEVEGLIQDQAALEGCKEWLGDLGRNPYSPVSPLQGSLPTHFQKIREVLS